MKKLACVLLLLVLGVSTIGAASAANPMQVPYSVPDEQVTGQTVSLSQNMQHSSIKYRKKFMEIPLIIMQQTRSMKVEIPVVWIPLLFRRKSLQA